MPNRNVLLITVDDLRPELNCFGKKKLHTPNLDRLAVQSMCFDRAYCQAPLCAPSRTSLMSGLRPDENVYRSVHRACKNGEPTLPGYLRQHGYETVSVGKVYHQNDDDESGWCKRYRNTFYEQEYVTHGYCSGYQLKENKEKVKNKARINVIYRKALATKGEMMQKYWHELPTICECADVTDNEYPDGIVAELAVKELHNFARSNQPFFLAAGFYRPHLPWAVPKQYWDLYRRDEIDLADNPFFPENHTDRSARHYDFSDFLHYGEQVITQDYSQIGHYTNDNFPVLSEEKQRECIHGYWASVSFVDAQIGKLLDALKETGLQDNTLVILCGDNGYHLGEHKLWSKTTSFEESTRVPLFISHPEGSAGQITKSLVELLDIYPTICEWCCLPQPEHLEGNSLFPILRDSLASVKDAAFTRLGWFSSMRTDSFRLTRFSWKDSDEVYELYDLKSDPRENVNVAQSGEYRDTMKRLVARLP